MARSRVSRPCSKARRLTSVAQAGPAAPKLNLVRSAVEKSRRSKKTRVQRKKSGCSSTRPFSFQIHFARPTHLGCRCGSLNSFRCGANHVNDAFRLGEHGHVAAVELIGGCTHSLGEEALQVRMHGVVFFADDVPARLRLSSGSSEFRLEQVGLGNALRRPDELLLLLREVSAKILRAVR